MAPRRNHNTPHHHQQPHQKQQDHEYERGSQDQQHSGVSGVITNFNRGELVSSRSGLVESGGDAIEERIFLNFTSSPAILSSSSSLVDYSIQLTSSAPVRATTTTPTDTTSVIMSPIQSGNTIHGQTRSGGVGVESNNTTAPTFTRCCLPSGDCFKTLSPAVGIATADYSIPGLIRLDDLNDCVRLICNNENCSIGEYMHRECFESWEQTILQTLKSNGRARSWSDRQRLQNLWTKKGYDLVYKACGCKCGSGHIRKDLEWSPSTSSSHVLKNGYNGNFTTNATSATTNGTAMMNSPSSNCGNTNGRSSSDNDSDATKKKKKRNRNNQKPTLTMTPINPSSYHPNSQQQQQQHHQQQHHPQPQQQQQHHHNHHNQIHTNGGSGGGGGSGSLLANGSGPPPNIGVIGSGLHNHQNSSHANGNNSNHHNQQQQQQHPNQHQLNHTNNNSNNLHNDLISSTLNSNNFGDILGLDFRARAASFSSSNGSTSPPVSSDLNLTPIHRHSLRQQHQQGIPKSNNTTVGGLLTNNNCTESQSNGCAKQNASSTSTLQQQQQQPPPPPAQQYTPIEQQLIVQQQKNKEVEIYSERVRSTSGCNGIFSRRLDFSSFNLLPRTRLNSYQVKIEDEGNHGNDDTRLFILSSLAQTQKCRVACILCEESMLVFDRYPLVDGSFFLSPKQHSSECIEVKYEGRTMYLTCVCMGCLDDSSTNRIIKCSSCGARWRGSHLVLGTMYAYDIFAAMPCCAERLKCNACFKLLLHPQQRLNFYSDYSRAVTCPYCSTQDTHFVKQLSVCYTKIFNDAGSQLA